MHEKKRCEQTTCHEDHWWDFEGRRVWCRGVESAPLFYSRPLWVGRWSAASAPPDPNASGEHTGDVDPA